jgi:hypothetical protein
MPKPSLRALTNLANKFPHGTRVRGNSPTPGTTRPRPCARRPRPLCPGGDVVLPWCVAVCSPASGGKHRTSHARPAPYSGIPPRSGDYLSHYAAWTLWLLGYLEQSLIYVHEALALAHELSHSYGLASTRGYAAYVYQFCRDVAAVYEQAEAAIALATVQGLPAWMSPVARRRNRWSCVPPLASLVGGKARGSETKRVSYWSRYICGLLRGSILLTSRTPRGCWMSEPDGKSSSVADMDVSDYNLL